MGNNEIAATVAALCENDCSCVIRKDGRNHLFYRRGVADLYDVLHTEPRLLQGAVVADKVVGKGAAALMIAGGIAALHTRVISEQALALFGDTGVEVTYDECVPYIVNRARDGRCPLESQCDSARTVADCLPLIDDFVRTLKT